jgi:aspartyl-tRNA(Asn)/glutamyl-tRNA(Gln) amidotransferase subunit A
VSACYAWAMDFREQSLLELADEVRSGSTGARELVAHSLERIETLNPVLNAFVSVNGEAALASAHAIDEAVARGEDPGPLAGIPIGVKDLEHAVGFPTTNGSAIFAGSSPVSADSPLVARLKAAGCVVVGKTNTPEFGWKADTVNATFGRTRNPWHTEHSAGGSSGGTAAALSSGMVPLATGSDGGGSVRIPASCCGLSGVKPSLGRVPSGGTEPPGWPLLSTKAPMACRMADVVTALDVAVGPDPSDLSSLPRPEASWPAALKEAKLPKKVAWSPTLGYAPVDEEVRVLCEKALGVLEAMGTEVVQLDKVFDEDPVGDWLTLTISYALRTLSDHRSSELWNEVDPLLAAQVDHAAGNVTALDVVRAMDSCHSLNLKLVEVFREARLLITPTCAGPPPPTELDGAGIINGEVDYNWVRFTYPFNMTRSPAASVCVGLTENGLPVGLQLIGPQHADLVVIRSAAALESAIGFDKLPPIGL